MANETKNIFISHIHEDDEGLDKLKSLPEGQRNDHPGLFNQRG